MKMRVLQIKLKLITGQEGLLSRPLLSHTLQLICDLPAKPIRKFFNAVFDFCGWIVV